MNNLGKTSIPIDIRTAKWGGALYPKVFVVVFSANHLMWFFEWFGFFFFGPSSLGIGPFEALLV
jgi:hypothetical protein